MTTVLGVIFLGLGVNKVDEWLARMEEVRATVKCLDPACMPHICGFDSVGAGIGYLLTTEHPVDLVVVENQVGMEPADLERWGAELAQNMRHLAGKARVKIEDDLQPFRRVFEAQNVGVLVVCGEMRIVLCALFKSRQTDPLG